MTVEIPIGEATQKLTAAGYKPKHKPIRLGPQQGEDEPSTLTRWVKTDDATDDASNYIFLVTLPYRNVCWLLRVVSWEEI